MTQDIKKWVSLIVVLIIAIGGYMFPRVQESFSAGSSTPGTRWPHGITVGLPSNSPTNIADIKAGTCSLIATTFTVAASTTVPMDCAVTGVISGDVVFANFATSSSVGNGWVINGASASTTSGFVTFRVTNWTGASATPPSGIASSTPYLIVKTQ